MCTVRCKGSRLADLLRFVFLLITCCLVAQASASGNAQECEEQEDGYCLAKEGLSPTNIVVMVTEQQEASIDKSKVKSAVEQLRSDGYYVLTTADLKLGSRAWAIAGVLPELDELWDKDLAGKSWLFWLCDAATTLDPKNLSTVLDAATQSPDTEKALIGRALLDTKAAIIHHYMKPGELDMARSLRSEPPQMRFSIDPYHELAKLVRDKGGVVIQDSAKFCYSTEADARECAAISPGPDVSLDASNAPRIGASDLVIGVKTWTGNHGKRLPVVRRTWAKDADTVVYFSDTADEEQRIVDAGPNTERGHCGKLQFALAYFYKNFPEKKWFYVADDDTILSVERYGFAIHAMVIGERYGYEHNMASDFGYSYPTLGCGMAISRAALRQIMANGFACPSRDTPDDMFFGILIRNLGIPLVHHHGFHQEPPGTYAAEIISDRGPHIAFHRFENVDVDEVYARQLGGRLD